MPGSVRRRCQGRARSCWGRAGCLPLRAGGQNPPLATQSLAEAASVAAGPLCQCPWHRLSLSPCPCLSPSSRSWGAGDRVGFGAPQELPPGHCCLQGSSCMERLSPGSPSLRHPVGDMVLGTGRRMGTAPCPLGTAKVVAFGEFLQSWRISLVPSGSVGGAERIWHHTGGWWWWWGHIPPGRRQHRCQHVVAMAICFCRGPSGRLLLFIILIWPQSPLLEVDWDVCPPGRAKGDVHTFAPGGLERARTHRAAQEMGSQFGAPHAPASQGWGPGWAGTSWCRMLRWMSCVFPSIKPG